MATETGPSGANEPFTENDEALDRETQPVDDEGIPHLPFPVVGIGASAGGLEAVSAFLAALPANSGMAFVLVQHLAPDRESFMPEILANRTDMTVRQADDGMAIEPDHVYVIPPGRVLTLNRGSLCIGSPLGGWAKNRPLDVFFKSLAEEQRERAIAIILSGTGSNGTAGAQAVKAVGGLCVAQDPDSALFPSMPRHVMEAGYADYVLAPHEMPEVLLTYARHPYARGDRSRSDIDQAYVQSSLREVMSLLRVRRQQDFSGYKTPTMLRRVQRRMGMAGIGDISDYVKLLRRQPAEVSSLADDMLIHVTGFFRDPEAWEVLRERVIVPLIDTREAHASVRAWVTACSSGEEAYTLGMLLVEEAERAGKPLDIRVFATDLAERSLHNARQGVYPSGIETEIAPERLERFFHKEEAGYRVRQDLRERVIFAPQNLLQDPPFSRLDIVTCRNLLIYLTPEVQHRLLGLLHFGLREGGTLFLGTSETTPGGTDTLFDPIDKKSRIFRRAGATRRGLDFPLPHAVAQGFRRGQSPERWSSQQGKRIPIAELTIRALLEHHTPAALTIDRDLRIVYYHGLTDPFLTQPRGEPTRELLKVTKESLRGAVSAAVHRAMTEATTATALDGSIETAPGKKVRIAVTAFPLEGHPPEFFAVTFQERADLETEANGLDGAAGKGGDDLANDGVSGSELRRIRDELQGAIEALQGRNEELQVASEEIVSTNEELQSTNEELETSREEMQSLNEELTTVNSQLQAKAEEHQAATNDLSSLLTSTDIAVLFLDMQFRIRRFTPKIKDLIDLIPADVGRPVGDLARKFDDPNLVDDARAVSESLVPIEREISGANNRFFLRRITPYRTVDNRIDGVVIAFVEITVAKQAQIALHASEEQLRLLVDGARGFAMMMLDPSGCFETWNAGAERLLGFKEGEAVGQPSALIFTPEDREAGAPQEELAQALHSGHSESERWHVRKDGERFWGSGVVTAIAGSQGKPIRYVKVLRDTTDQKRAKDVLEKAKQEAESSNSLKDDFLATLSHELRTPLSTILIWANLLHELPTGSPQFAEAITNITRSAEVQRQLMDDLLDTSRIAAGKIRLDLKPKDLGEIVRGAVEEIRVIAEGKKIRIEPSLGPDLGVVRADPIRLRQVIWNLLTNAVKFTDPGGLVEVAVQRSSAEVEIEVTDSGKGIDPEFLPHVFEAFRQEESSANRRHGGLGLGLAICKKMVELHGGTVTAQSRGRGHGAKFIVKLPLVPLAPAAGAGEGEGTGGGSRQATAVTLKGQSFLLVEDDPATRGALTAVLRQAGAEVVAAQDAAAGLEAFERERPALVVSDIGMAGEDGYSLMRRLRALETSRGWSRTPCLALTAFAGAGDRDKALTAGFDGHLAKPVAPEALLKELTDLLSHR